MTDRSRRLGWFAAMPSAGLIGLARLYQATLRPILGGQCRFVPTCSEYWIEAVRTRGAIRGGIKGLWRILRCHPFGGGGYDPP
jgi:hypothetical protein